MSFLVVAWMRYCARPSKILVFAFASISTPISAFCLQKLSAFLLTSDFKTLQLSQDSTQDEESTREEKMESIRLKHTKLLKKKAQQREKLANPASLFLQLSGFAK